MMSQEERQKRADEVKEHPQFFCVCVGCEAIVKRGRAFCPNCLGYHFDEDPTVIRKHAELLASRPQQTEVIEWEY